MNSLAGSRTNVTAASERLQLLAIAVALAAFAACAGPRRNYFEARAHDLGRCGTLALSLGPGFGARVTVTRYAQAGLLALESAEQSSQLAPDGNLTVGLRRGEVGAWSLREVEYGLTPWYGGDQEIRPLHATSPSIRSDPTVERGTECSAQVHLALIGAEVGVDPIAIVRFVGGLIGLGEAGFFDAPPAEKSDERGQ